MKVECDHCRLTLVDDQSVYGCAHYDARELREAFDERAAILEFDGNHRRSDAERLARGQIADMIRRKQQARP